MKGSITAPIFLIQSFLTIMVLLGSNGYLAAESSAFIKEQTLEVAGTRVSSASMTANSFDGSVEMDLKGYNLTYHEDAEELELSFRDEKHFDDFSKIQGSYSSIDAPSESTEIDSKLCVYSKNNVLVLDPKGCQN